MLLPPREQSSEDTIYTLELMKFNLLSQEEEEAYKLKFSSKYVPFYATFFKEYDSLIREEPAERQHAWTFFEHTTKYTGNTFGNYLDNEEQFLMNHFICIYLYNPTEGTFHFQIRKLSQFDETYIENDFVNIQRSKIKTIKLSY